MGQRWRKAVPVDAQNNGVLIVIMAIVKSTRLGFVELVYESE
jgi:hypothetical protein